MACVVIVGAQWGDEGKGKIVDKLAGRAQIVVRFQGGDNAGHTVYHAGRKHVFHVLPSGMLRKGVLNLIAGGVVVNLAKLAGELSDLGLARSVWRKRLRISGEAALILPCHVALDEVNETRRGKGRIGTTLRGIGPAYADRAARTGVRFEDIFNRQLLRERLELCFDSKRALLDARRAAETCNVRRAAAELGRLAALFRPLLADTGLILERCKRSGGNILFEGAQGAMLDVCSGTYPFVTSSHTIAGGACVGAGVGPHFPDKIIGIAKAYVTRVGEGPCPTELEDATGARLREAGGEYGATTGRPRRCGWLDLVQLRRAVRLNSMDGIILTKLDVLDSFDEIGVCTAYRLRGRRLTEWPAQNSDAFAVEPQYVYLPGWRQPTSGISAFKSLPARARAYVAFIEKHVRIPVVAVSAGRERESVIVRQELFA